MSKAVKTIYYTDELNDEFSTAKITPKKIGADYNYIGNYAKPFWQFFWYKMIARPIGYLFLKIHYGHRIVGKTKLKPFRKKGYFLYANHTNDVGDAFIPSMVAFPKSVYVIVHPNNVSMPVLGRITPFLGALPLPDDMQSAKNFNNAIKHYYEKNNVIMIYPEAHIWPYYTKIRNFRDSSFAYPITNDAPVFCFTNTYQKRRFRNTPRIVTYINGPFYPSDEGSLKEKKKVLRDIVYENMDKETIHNNVVRVRYEHTVFGE